MAIAPDYTLDVLFDGGVTKSYDVSRLFARIPAFRRLEAFPDEFTGVYVDVGGYGVVWSDDLDLSSDELWDNGVAAGA